MRSDRARKLMQCHACGQAGWCYDTQGLSPTLVAGCHGYVNGYILVDQAPPLISPVPSALCAEGLSSATVAWPSRLRMQSRIIHVGNIYCYPTKTHGGRGGDIFSIAGICPTLTLSTANHVPYIIQ